MEGRTMLGTIRLWMGATRRERELRALADDLHHECDRWAERVEADRWAHKAAMAALRKQLEAVIVERDAARRQANDERAKRFAVLGSKAWMVQFAEHLAGAEASVSNLAYRISELRELNGLHELTPTEEPNP